jgi:hypothetical protein
MPNAIDAEGGKQKVESSKDSDRAIYPNLPSTMDHGPSTFRYHSLLSITSPIAPTIAFMMTIDY